MEARNPVHKDSIELLLIYSDGDHDPDAYTIWLDGAADVVTRTPGESAHALFARVRDAIKYRRYLGRNANPPMRRNAFAYVFAGITPLRVDIDHIARREFELALLSIANSGETADERVYALSILTEMLIQKSATARTEQAQ